MPAKQSSFVRMPTAAVGQQEPSAASTSGAGDRLLGCANACRTHTRTFVSTSINHVREHEIYVHLLHSATCIICIVRCLHATSKR